MDAPETRAGALAPLVREHAETSERERHLAAPVARAFAEQDLYRIAAPTSIGGGGASPLSQIRTIEVISAADGSAGWNLMIGIESCGLILPAMGRCMDMLEDPKLPLCSSTAAVGEAVRVEGGYRINGRWPFVSGCHNAEVFGGTVRVEGMNGNRYAMLAPGQWQILDTWHVGGLRGSGSHDVEVVDQFVPDERIVLAIGGTRTEDPILNFPLGARLAYNKVAVSLGIAAAAVACFVELAQGKHPRFTSSKLAEQTHAQSAVAEAHVRVARSRAHLFAATEHLWRQVLEQAHINTAERGEYQIACSDAVRSCTEAVELVAEAAGTTANRLEHPLERLARDIRVVRQHFTVASQHIADGGRTLLGQPATGLMLTTLGRSS